MCRIAVGVAFEYLFSIPLTFIGSSTLTRSAPIDKLAIQQRPWFSNASGRQLDTSRRLAVGWDNSKQGIATPSCMAHGKLKALWQPNAGTPAVQRRTAARAALGGGRRKHMQVRLLACSPATQPSPSHCAAPQKRGAAVARVGRSDRASAPALQAWPRLQVTHEPAAILTYRVSPQRR